MTKVRSPALAAIAAWALSSLLMQHDSNKCDAFSVGIGMQRTPIGKAGYNPVTRMDGVGVNSSARLQASVSTEEEADSAETDVELKKDNFGIYDLTSKAEHL